MHVFLSSVVPAVTAIAAVIYIVKKRCKKKVVEPPPSDATPQAPPYHLTPLVVKPLTHGPTLVQHVSVQEEETNIMAAGDSSQSGVCMYVCI